MVGVARSAGGRGRARGEPDELADRVAGRWHGDVPRLFDVPIERTTPSRLNYG